LEEPNTESEPRVRTGSGKKKENIAEGDKNQVIHLEGIQFSEGEYADEQGALETRFKVYGKRSKPTYCA